MTPTLIHGRAGWRGWLAAMVLVCLGLSPIRLSGAELTGGPKVEAVTVTNATVRWTTDVPTGSRVQFGVKPGQLDRRAEGAVTNEHVVTLPGLQPGTRYFFSVGTARFAFSTNSFLTAAGNATATTIPPPATIFPIKASAPPARETWGQLASLQDHFDRHGRDFKAKDAEDYARQAWEFLQRARAGELAMKLDQDGVLRVFDPQTKAFAAYTRTGKTKTFFKPQSRDYFARQPGRPVKPGDLPFK